MSIGRWGLPRVCCNRRMTQLPLCLIYLTVILASLGSAIARDLREPRDNRIYAAIHGQARIAVALQPGLEWQVVDESGGAVRAWGIRAAHATLTIALGLRSGGSLGGVTPGEDGNRRQGHALPPHTSPLIGAGASHSHGDHRWQPTRNPIPP